MGRNRNRRDRQIQIDEAELSSPAPGFHRWNPSVRAPPSPQFGPPSPSIDDGNSTFNRDNPFQRHPQPPQQDQPHQQWYQNDRKQPYPYTQTRQGIPLYIFVQKSRLKQNLVRAFDQALAQIEQWYPDATAGGDLMEWQPENEIVIPQSDHTVYTYGLPVMQMGEHGNAENQVQESMLGAAPSARRGTVSDVGVSTSKACSAADETWDGAPRTRRYPEPECAPLISYSLDARYRID